MLFQFLFVQGQPTILLGYVSAFMWALINNASYFIANIEPFDDNTQRPIGTAYDPLFINWTMSFNSSEPYECLLPLNAPQYSPARKQCKEGSLDLESGERVKYIPLHGINNYGPFESNFMERTDHQLYLIASNRGFTFRVFDNLKYGEILNNFGLTRHTIFPCLFNYLFKMRPEVCSSACQRTAASLKPDHRHDHSILRIGIQIRYAFQHPGHFNCIDQLLDKYNSKEIIMVLICADDDVQRKAKERYGSRLLLPEGEPSKVTHVHDRFV